MDRTSADFFPELPIDSVKKTLGKRQVPAVSRHLQDQVLDRATALARVGGDLDLLKEIAGLFLDEYPRALDEICQAPGPPATPR